MFCQIQSTVEGCLTTHGGQQRIGALSLYNFRHRIPFNWLDVGGIRHRRICHNRSRIGIDQDNSVSLLPERFTSLSAGVIKFTGLTDNNRAGTKNQNAVYIGSFRHGVSTVTDA